MQWYYTQDNDRCGPVSEEQLRGLVASGTLQPTDLVWRDGMIDWTSAGSIDGLCSTQSAVQSPAVPVQALPASIENRHVLNLDGISDEEIRRRLNLFAKSTPHHQLNELGTIVTLREGTLASVYRVTANLLHEHRSLEEMPVRPYDGSSIPPQTVTADSFEIWSVALPTPTEMNNSESQFSVAGSETVCRCGQCGGHGSLRCGDCGGSGQCVCWRCGGRKMISCPECSSILGLMAKSEAERKAFCRTCGNIGKVPCTSCAGSGFAVCNGCGASGSVRCSVCAGAGNLVSGLAIRRRLELLSVTATVGDESSPSGAQDQLKDNDFDVVHSESVEDNRAVNLPQELQPLEIESQRLLAQAVDQAGDENRIVSCQLEIARGMIAHVTYAYQDASYEVWLPGKGNAVFSVSSPIADSIHDEVEESLRLWHGGEKKAAAHVLRRAIEMGIESEDCRLALSAHRNALPEELLENALNAKPRWQRIVFWCGIVLLFTPPVVNVIGVLLLLIVWFFGKRRIKDFSLDEDVEPCGTSLEGSNQIGSETATSSASPARRELAGASVARTNAPSSKLTFSNWHRGLFERHYWTVLRNWGLPVDESKALRIGVQIAAWTLYGFIWIPIAYAIAVAKEPE